MNELMSWDNKTFKDSIRIVDLVCCEKFNDKNLYTDSRFDMENQI